MQIKLYTKLYYAYLFSVLRIEFNFARKGPKFAELLTPHIIWGQVDQAFCKHQFILVYLIYII